MIEAVAIIALLLLSRRLRRAARQPQSIRIDVFHHFPDGGGERQPEDVLDHAVGSNVIPLHAGVAAGHRR